MVKNVIKGTVFNTEFEQGCRAITNSDEFGNFTAYDSERVAAEFNVSMITELVVDMKTMDGYPITDGMVVWDYDLEVVTVDLTEMNDTTLSDFYRQPDPIGQYWFYVKTKDGGKKSMSDTRVRVYHPYTGKKAEKSE